ncbi:MAG: DUF1570 domain-containing protein [Planctomycetota bacterium]|nr:DUF1570 domain-containing protein [Planctomycetota bacterium]
MSKLLSLSKWSGFILAFQLALCPSSFANDINTAEQLYEKKNFSKAFKIATALNAKTPKNDEVLGLIGKIHFRLNRYEKAKEYLQLAADIEPDVWGDLNATYKALTAFIYGDDETVKKTVATIDPGWVKTELTVLINPNGMKSRKSKKGRYQIYTDAGIQRTKGDAYASMIMDKIHDAYSKVFPFKMNPKVISRVYIFSTTAKFNQFNADLGSDMSHAAGYYSPQTKVLVINADPKGSNVNPYGFSRDAVDTMFHEGFHQFIDMFASNIPKWFDEGIAEYFGPSQFISKKKLRVGVVLKNDNNFVTRYQRIRESVRANDPLPPLSLNDLIKPGNKNFGSGSSRSSVSYAQSWSFIHFLLHSKSMGKKGKKLIKKYFTMLKNGQTVEEAHKATFGKLKLRKIEKAWRSYVLNL